MNELIYSINNDELINCKYIKENYKLLDNFITEVIKKALIFNSVKEIGELPIMDIVIKFQYFRVQIYYSNYDKYAICLNEPSKSGNIRKFAETCNLFLDLINDQKNKNYNFIIELY